MINQDLIRASYPGEENEDFLNHGNPADILASFNETEFLAETYCQT